MYSKNKLENLYEFKFQKTNEYRIIQILSLIPCIIFGVLSCLKTEDYINSLIVSIFIYPVALIVLISIYFIFKNGILIFKTIILMYKDIKNKFFNKDSFFILFIKAKKIDLLDSKIQLKKKIKLKKEEYAKKIEEANK